MIMCISMTTKYDNHNNDHGDNSTPSPPIKCFPTKSP